MATTPAYPGVYIQELTSDVHPITGVATSICAFVGYTATGIDNRPEQIFSFSDYTRIFGGLAANSEVSYAVQQFFANGGTLAWVVRTPMTGAVAAAIKFNSMTFTALSSGTWANGVLLVDVDFNAVADSNSFNLTFTNTLDGTVESFPNVSMDNTVSNYYVNIVNDPDNGSQLVSVVDNAPGSNVLPIATGLVSTNISIGTVNQTLAGTIGGTVAITAGSNQVTGTGTNFANDVAAGNWIVFTSDATQTLYRVSSVDSAAAPQTLTLGSPYLGAAYPATDATVSKSTSATILIPSASPGYGVSLTCTSPAASALPPLPIDIPVFATGSVVPQTVTGLAAQLQKAINSALSVQLPGASVKCSVVSTTAASVTTQTITVSAMLPNYPNAVIAFGPPSGASGLDDASVPAILGLKPPSNNGGAGNVAHYALGTPNSYDSTTSIAGTAGSGLPTTAGLIGAQTVPPTGIYALESVDIFNLLCIPEATRAMAGNPSVLDPTVDPNAIYSVALGLCDLKRAMLLIDCPPNVNTVSAAVDWKTSGLTVSDPNGAAFFPRLRLPDPLNNYALRTFAPCGVVAGLYARTDTSRGVWKAPAGIDATLTGVQQLVYKMTDAEQGVLNPLGLNCFRNFPVYGSVLWGARTLVGADADASQWKYVPVRRVALFLESSLWQGTQWVVFEPNDEPLWSAIRLNIGAFMQNLFLQGYFQGTTPAQAYFVKCDSETTTQTDIDNGVVNIVVGFAPLEPAEFVVIQIQQMSGQTAS